MICARMLPPPMILGLAPAMSAGGGRTTAPRIRISRPGAGSARCSASRARAQRKDFSPLTLPSSTPSTSNATSLPLQRIALSAPRRSARGARQLRLLKISRATGPSRPFVGKVTRPARARSAAACFPLQLFLDACPALVRLEWNPAALPIPRVSPSVFIAPSSHPQANSARLGS